MGDRPQGFKGLVHDLLGCAVPTFGETVNYRSCEGGDKTIVAVFDREYLAVDPDTERVISTNGPIIGVRLCDLPAKPVKGDSVVIQKEKFKVVDSQEDGQGGATLILHRVDPE